MVDISDDAVADVSADGRNQRHAAGRHVHHLAGIFGAVSQHVAAKEIDAHALVAPTLLRVGEDCGFLLWQRHRGDLGARVHRSSYADVVNAPLSAWRL
jgi:hypothetical protein